MEAKKQWGISEPLSRALPTEKENELSNALLADLRSRNNFETPEKTEHRTKVLAHFQKVTEAFVRHVGQLRRLPQSVLDTAGGRVATFGSFRLGVYGPGSDIDTLVIAPKHVSRDDFFEYFPKLLEDMSPSGAIEEMTPVRADVFVPIIKIEYSGVSIDLIFVRLTLPSVTSDVNLGDNNILRGLDEVDLRCINGTRVTDAILTLVPQTKTFRLALRAVKLWAQQRAVYANIVGFPGGVAWAMMVARVCQLYPFAAASIIIQKFFFLMSNWPWPRPVMLNEIEDGPLQQRVWNPMIYHGDKSHLMPIITPMYPAMCATHNVTRSTLTIIRREWKRAMNIVNAIIAKKLPWASLFERHTFFTEDYRNYLSVVAASPTKEAQARWSGKVQSKVRLLVSSLEQEDTGIELAHPYTKGFERVHHCKTDAEKNAVFQGSVAYQVAETKSEEINEINVMKAETSEEPATETEMNEDGSVTVYTTTFYIGLEVKPGAKSPDISGPVDNFKHLCQSWEHYDGELNSLRVVFTKAFNLPDDVFEPGEIKPVPKEKKKKPAKAAAKPAPKRDVSAAGLDDENKTDAKRPHTEERTNGAVKTPG